MAEIGALKYAFEGVLEFDKEDGGMAMIAQVGGESGNLFARVQSWSEATPPAHPEATALAGRRVRVTIETLDGTVKPPQPRPMYDLDAMVDE